MAPPTYNDIGAASRDLFSKHYHFGIVKLNFKTKTSTGVEFVVNGSQNDKGLVASTLETKYNIKTHGVTLKQKWDTNNVLTGEATVEDYFVRGLKTGLSASFSPQNGKRSGKLICGYKSIFFNLNSDVDFDYAGAVCNGAGVFGYLGWLAGIKMTFDSTENKLSRSNFALGYQTRDFHVTGHLEDGQDVNCSLYRKVNDELEAGVNVACSLNSKTPKFGLCFHYNLGDGAAIRAKVNSASQIGIGVIHRLGKGVSLTVGSLVDAKSYVGSSHKIGLALDFET